MPDVLTCGHTLDSFGYDPFGCASDTHYGCAHLRWRQGPAPAGLAQAVNTWGTRGTADQPCTLSRMNAPRARNAPGCMGFKHRRV